MSLLQVRDLSVEFLGKQNQMAVRALNFDLGLDQTVGIVGESGSGKSTVALALLGLLAKQGRIRSGNILWSYQGEQIDLLAPNTSARKHLRGERIALIAQHPGSALNPYLNIGTQMTEHLIWHSKCSHAEARKTAIGLLRQVQIKQPKQVLRGYPHQFSGGQQQRIAIAMALMTDPVLLIADEPTTALDTTVQAQVLTLLRDLQRERRMAMLFITHDLRVVSQLADEVLVMQNGSVVEKASPQNILYAPQADYTRQLIASLPSSTPPQNAVDGTYLLRAKHLSLSFATSGWRARRKPVLHDVSLDIREGEIVGIVGESGTGKSTLARALLGLLPVESGEVWFQGKALSALSKKQMLAARARMQMVFQNPYASLNPRQTIYQTLSEALCLHNVVPKADIAQRINILLEEVELPTDIAQRYPHQFSGGQRQRLSIARALATEPKLLIADEPLSALDITTQAQIIRLLQKLMRDRQLSVLFISHDLSTVQSLCSRVIVMNEGRVVETGATQAIFEHPRHSFTRALLSAVPQLPGPTVN